MAYKIENPYKDCHIMDLNLMDIHYHRRLRFNVLEVLVMCAPVIAIGFIFAVSGMSEMGFFAECQNIPGGDICHITIK